MAPLFLSSATSFMSTITTNTFYRIEGGIICRTRAQHSVRWCSAWLANGDTARQWLELTYVRPSLHSLATCVSPPSMRGLRPDGWPWCLRHLQYKVSRVRKSNEPPSHCERAAASQRTPCLSWLPPRKLQTSALLPMIRYWGCFTSLRHCTILTVQVKLCIHTLSVRAAAFDQPGNAPPAAPPPAPNDAAHAGNTAARLTVTAARGRGYDCAGDATCSGSGCCDSFP
jgi:hypothetical protein